MYSNGFTIIIPFIIYLVCMTGIGFYFYRRTAKLSDYILGGRGLNPWVTSLSAQASDMSGWLLLGLPGFAYIAGLESIWIALGLLAGTWLNWKFVAEKLRRYSEKYGNSLTLPEYFENRFEDKTRIVRSCSALFILLFFLIYTASGFVAGAKLFSTVFAISYTTALITGILVIITYTFLGGFLAVSWTDFFQGMIMFLAIIIVPFIALRATGGFSEICSVINGENRQLLNPFTGRDGDTLTLISVLSSLGWGLGYFGQPHILARFMAIKNPGEINRARHIAMVWVFITLTGAVSIGLAGIAVIEPALSREAGETVFMVMVNKLVPPLIAGFLLAAILAAIMSTADSQLLVTSSAFTEDFYRIFLRKNAGDRELVWVSRFGVIIISLIAFFIALDPHSSVLRLVSYAWAGFGATFGPMVILSLFWKRMTANGAIAGIVSGGVTVIIWKNLHSGIFELYEIIPGFIISVTAIIITSMLGKSSPEIAVKIHE